MLTFRAEQVTDTTAVTSSQSNLVGIEPEKDKAVLPSRMMSIVIVPNASVCSYTV